MKMKRKARSCYLCLFRNPFPDCGVSLHKFPYDRTIRSLWLQACGLNEETDDVKNVCICSLHFRAEDFSPCSSSRRLKKDAVPSVNVKNKKVELIKETLQNEAVVMKNGFEFVVSCVQDSGSGVAAEDFIDETSIVKVEPETEEEVLEKQVKLETDEEDVESDDISSTDLRLIDNDALLPTNTVEKPKRIFDVPRYMNDITISHFETPEKATVALNVIRRHVENQAKKIKALRQSNSRLSKRVNNLQSLLKELQKS